MRDLCPLIIMSEQQMVKASLLYSCPEHFEARVRVEVSQVFFRDAQPAARPASG
jgi:hypothetical protein